MGPYDGRTSLVAPSVDLTALDEIITELGLPVGGT